MNTEKVKCSWLEKKMAIQSSILAWEIPRTEDSAGLQSMGSQRIRHHLGTKHQQQNGHWSEGLMREKVEHWSVR